VDKTYQGGHFQQQIFFFFFVKKYLYIISNEFVASKMRKIRPLSEALVPFPPRQKPCIGTTRILMVVGCHVGLDLLNLLFYSGMSGRWDFNNRRFFEKNQFIGFVSHPRFSAAGQMILGMEFQLLIYRQNVSIHSTLTLEVGNMLSCVCTWPRGNAVSL
jgi:hypothetical protein